MSNNKITGALCANDVELKKLGARGSMDFISKETESGVWSIVLVSKEAKVSPKTGLHWVQYSMTSSTSVKKTVYFTEAMAVMAGFHEVEGTGIRVFFPQEHRIDIQDGKVLPATPVNAAADKIARFKVANPLAASMADDAIIALTQYVAFV